MDWPIDWLEVSLATSPAWLLVARRFARTGLTRSLLLGVAVYAALVIALSVWMDHDCGPSGIIGFSHICDSTPHWLAKLLDTPVILALLALPAIIAVALIVALIHKILHRLRR